MNKFQVIKPSVLLAPYVKQYWFVSLKDITQGSQRLVPFGCTALSFYRGHRTYSLMENDDMPQSLLHGITANYTDITFSGDIDFICVVFQPAGAKAFFPMPLNELNQSYVSLDALGDHELHELELKLNDTTDNLKCVGHIEQFLFHRIYQLDNYEDKRINAVIHSITHGETDINQLAETACLGYKQFKRVFTQHMGTNPKSFLQITRFQKLHHLLQQHVDTTLSQLAFECGYYDKSHLIKELKEFSGFTPRELSEACDPVYSDYHALFRSAFVDLPSDKTYSTIIKPKNKMTLDKNCDIQSINCDDYTLADFLEYRGEDLFEVTNYFSAYLKDAVQKGYMVYGNPITSSPIAEFTVHDNYTGNERDFLNFCSYNYLGYSYHPQVIREVQQTLAKYGTGAVSAPLLSGYYDLSKQLETRIAQFKRKEDAVLFPTGYGANLGVLSSLLQPGDVAVLDILSHASIYDGAKLAGANIKVFSHNNAEHLEKILKGLNTKRAIVCVEGIYSMDGDMVNLPEIVSVCQKYGVRILLDEAHSTLIFGENGRGIAEHFGLEDQIDITIGTFSKSFGAIGGFATGSSSLISYIRMFARSYVFSCAMAPHTIAGILKVLELYEQDKSGLKKLWDNTRYMQTKLKEAGLNIGETQSQVIPVIVGNDRRLREISRFIHSKGLYTGVVTFPAVSSKRTRLRLSMSSNHTIEQMDACIHIIKEAFEQ